MASLVAVRGLLRIGQQASESTGYLDTRNIQTMSIDDNTTALAQSHTALNTGGWTGGTTNQTDQVFDATPSTSTDSTSATISHLTTYGTAVGNFTIKRVTLHDDTAANVTTTSATLVGGVDAQTLAKTSDFTLAITLRIKYTSV